MTGIELAKLSIVTLVIVVTGRAIADLGPSSQVLGIGYLTGFIAMGWIINYTNFLKQND